MKLHLFLCSKFWILVLQNYKEQGTSVSVTSAHVSWSQMDELTELVSQSLQPLFHGNCSKGKKAARGLPLAGLLSRVQNTRGWPRPGRPRRGGRVRQSPCIWAISWSPGGTSAGIWNYKWSWAMKTGTDTGCRCPQQHLGHCPKAYSTLGLGKQLLDFQGSND